MSDIIFRFKGFLFSLCLLLAILAASPRANALPADFYASESVLASGKWVKVAVTETGMQLISNTLLKNLGFSNPDEVNVYGFGGRMLSENLDAGMPDDLPIVASLKTPQGIVFFGHASVGWGFSRSADTKYAHYSNPYSDNAYYFISDVNPERKNPEESAFTATPSGETITVFTERIVHERDIIAPSNTGRLLLGEDFRTQRNQTFNFNLPGNTGDAVMTASFGAKTASGISSLIFSANGSTLPAANADNISSSSASKFINVTTTSKRIADPGEKLSLGISFSASGNVSTAALDYIEIEYPRKIAIEGNELYFYLNPNSPSTVLIEGCSENTILWDVTDPQNVQVIPTRLEGSSLSFTAAPEYKEYVAFNPAGIKRGVTSAGKIGNQNLHAMEAPGMLVIAPEIFRRYAMSLADLHEKTDGLSVVVVSPEEVYNEFSSGNPDVTAFRKLLKMWFDRASETDAGYTKYCLIMSRPTYDNKMVTQAVKAAGYPRVPIWQSPTGDTESSSYSTDDYIGMLNDNPSSLNIGTEKIHVAVGRMPVKSQAEAATAIKKLENYLLSPNYGSWRNNVMIIADDQDNGVHLNQAEACHEALRSNGNGANFLYEKLYLDSYRMVYTGTGASYPDAKQRMFDKFAEGVLFIDYIGHANPKTWGHENLLTWTDITTMSNTNLPFIYAATCEFLRWDDDAVSGAEELWLNPTAGVIGMICPSRSVLISANGILNKATSQFVFRRDAEGKGMRVGDIMVEGKNSGQTDTNKLRYGLIGDPSMRLPSPELLASVDTINGIDLSSGEMPVIKARSVVDISGVVSDSQGNVAEDFNGVVEIRIFDAEKVITTLGNGNDGVESVYNDRKTRLYSGRVKARNGRWKTTVSMPFEIENNYSPALISLYASDESGREANGACENFYVYGYNDDADDDFDGPEIIDFYLNTPAFASGDAVSPSPLLKASFSDPSGINVSDAGIGHSMMLCIDGKTYFEDAIFYYLPDDTDPTAGSLTYPFSGIEPGEHELSFTVWDNAGNSSSRSLKFKVSASWTPEIETLTTDVNPASSSVNFIVATDGASGKMNCHIDIFDLNGRKIWSGEAPDITSSSNRVSLGWDLCDNSGARVPRGIYLYRATVSGSNGATVTKTRKLAVTAK